MRMTGWLSALALSAAVCSVSFGNITGKVTLKGKPPEMKEITAMKAVAQCAQMHKDPLYEETVVTDEKGDLKNVVVSIKTPAGKTLNGRKPAKPATLDQKGCQYVPHVLALMVDQPVEAVNSDTFLHNVHTMSFDNDAENFAMVMVGKHKLGPFKTPETFQVKCDVHPWMLAYVRVLDNPYFAVTGEDGTYRIDTTGLPDGEYDLVFWQEKYGEKTQKVTVKDGKAEADFNYDADAKSEATAPASATKLVSLIQKAEPACCEPETKQVTAVAASK